MTPTDHFTALSTRYPDAWRLADICRADRSDTPSWPEWCFLPMAGWHAIVSEQRTVSPLDLDAVQDVARLAALGTWRISQGVYRFEPELFSALTVTPNFRNLSLDSFLGWPEWCVYIETPGLTWAGSRLEGFWSHLEYDVNNGRQEIRFLLHLAEKDIVPMPMHLGEWDIFTAVARVYDEEERIRGCNVCAPVEEQARDLVPLVNLAQYLCSPKARVRRADTTTVWAVD